MRCVAVRIENGRRAQHTKNICCWCGLVWPPMTPYHLLRLYHLCWIYMEQRLSITWKLRTNELLLFLLVHKNRCYTHSTVKQTMFNVVLQLQYSTAHTGWFVIRPILCCCSGIALGPVHRIAHILNAHVCSLVASVDSRNTLYLYMIHYTSMNV